MVNNIFKKEIQKRWERFNKDEAIRHIPIFIHGYDYCFPGGHENDPRKRQLYAKRDKWLGSAFKEKGINLTRDQEREIIKCMINDLYDMMGELAEN